VPREIHRRGNAVANVGTKAAGLLFQVLHHLRTHHAIGVAGKILHVVGDGELPAGLQAHVHHWRHVSARRINSGGVTGRAGADNQAFNMFSHDKIYSAKPCFAYR